jgi:hypothetical protein
MATKRSRGPVTDDVEVIRLNSLGYSLRSISVKLSCHLTTVHNRLVANGIEPMDTRHSFMETVYERLTPSLLDKLSNKLGPHYTIRDHITNLLIKDLMQP